MPKKYIVTLQITVGDELAAEGIPLIERKLSKSLDFDVDQWEWDITVDEMNTVEI